MKKTVILALVLALCAGLLCACGGQAGNWRVPQHIVICLDPGHGGSDPGAVIDGRQEKDDNLRMALAVREALEAFGSDRLEVIMTREEDTELELQQRVDIANGANATLFVAIHRNTGGGQGVETWISAQGDKYETRLAKYIQDGLISVTDTRNRGVKSGTASNPAVSYTVVGRTAMPACLIELGFMDDPLDARLFDSAFADYAAAIADGILKMVQLK